MYLVRWCENVIIIIIIIAQLYIQGLVMKNHFPTSGPRFCVSNFRPHAGNEVCPILIQPCFKSVLSCTESICYVLIGRYTYSLLLAEKPLLPHVIIISRCVTHKSRISLTACNVIVFILKRNNTSKQPKLEACSHAIL